MPSQPPRLSRVLATFLKIGVSAYGGVWANARRIERAVVDDNEWLDRDDVRSLLLVSTVIPAPKFVAMVTLIGERVRGLAGSAAAAFGLFAPASTVMVVAAVLVAPELLTGPLALVSETLGVVVVGLLTGNALYQWRTGKPGRRDRLVGTTLAIVMIFLMVVGAPLVFVAVGGFLLGPLLIKA